MKMLHVLLMLGILGSTGAVVAEEALPEDEIDYVAPEDQWIVRAGLNHRIYVGLHNALQDRADESYDPPLNWRDGDLDGRGWGLHVAVSRGLGELNFDFNRSDYEYKLDAGDAGFHETHSERRDLEIYWQEGRGQSERGVWGSSIGFRHVGLTKDITIREGSHVFEKEGNINWWLFSPGIFGDLRPFRNDIATLRVRGNLLLGEVNGVAREGNDADFDGNIEEQYGDDYSLAYGLNFDIELALFVTKDIIASAGYMREWLYSFDATEDTGVVVFPDNNDAMFIENSHYWYASIEWLF